MEKIKFSCDMDNKYIVPNGTRNFFCLHVFHKDLIPTGSGYNQIVTVVKLISELYNSVTILKGFVQ